MHRRDDQLIQRLTHRRVSGLKNIQPVNFIMGDHPQPIGVGTALNEPVDLKSTCG